MKSKLVVKEWASVADRQIVSHALTAPVFQLACRKAHVPPDTLQTMWELLWEEFTPQQHIVDNFRGIAQLAAEASGYNPKEIDAVIEHTFAPMYLVADILPAEEVPDATE